MNRLAAVISLLLIGPALWAMPTQITFQGTLKESGVPVNGNRNMQFSFVDGSGGTIPGTSPIPIANIQVTNGLFAVQLPLDPTVNWALYSPFIQVSVAGQILSPNQPLTANLYSMVANTVVDGAVTVAKLDPGVQGTLTPSGMIAMFASACPTGWSVYQALQGRVPVGNDPTNAAQFSIGETGGNLTHSHTLGAPTSIANGQWLFGDPQGSGSHPDNLALANHVHSVSTESSLPPYATVMFCVKS